MLNPADVQACLGQNVAGCRLLEIIGRGAAGAIYRASQVSLDREVAVKFLSSRIQSPGEVEGLLAEARTIGQLDHPAIVKVYNAGIHDQIPYIVMEYLRGETLHARLKRESPLPLLAAASVAREVALGLQAAHARGIVHRDLKPSNIFLQQDGQPKIIDFGLAFTLREGPRVQGGTPEYMAPEQWAFGTIDPRTDLYALGLILYRMTAGRNAYAGPGDKLREAHLRGDLRFPEDSPPLPEPLQDAIRRLAHRDPARRFASAADAAAVLEPLTRPAPPPLRLRRKTAPPPLRLRRRRFRP